MSVTINVRIPDLVHKECEECGLLYSRKLAFAADGRDWIWVTKCHVERLHSSMCGGAFAMSMALTPTHGCALEREKTQYTLPQRRPSRKVRPSWVGALSFDLSV